MQTTTDAPTAPGPRADSPLGRLRAARLALTSQAVAIACTAIIGLHLADDSFVQPEPGLSAGDHLPAGSCPSPW